MVESLTGWVDCWPCIVLFKDPSPMVNEEVVFDTPRTQVYLERIHYILKTTTGSRFLR